MKKKKKNPSENQPDQFPSCILYSDGRYSCTICNIAIKEKKNVTSHLKNKRHTDQAKDDLPVAEFDSCIVCRDGMYSCSICDIPIKQKKTKKR